jgi:hypothetical protein
MTIYEEMHKLAKKQLQSEKSEQEDCNLIQHEIAWELYRFLKDSGLSVELVAGGCVYDIYVTIDADTTGTVRVFYKSASNKNEKHKVEYLSPLICDSIVGRKRCWVSVSSNEQMLDLIKGDIVDVFTYKLKNK